MEESPLMVKELLTLCLQRIMMEESSESTEQELLQVLRNLEQVRSRWLHAELELKKFKELLVKSDVSKAALEVKLKHTRNQLDVEMKKRYKIEGDYQYLQRQMQLMCDILFHDTRSSSALNDEQKSLLATFERGGNNMMAQRSSKQLSVIDESSFMSVCHSDISYDRTDDDVDVDSTAIKPLKSRARERRRSSMGPAVGGLMGKRVRGRNVSVELLERHPVDKEVETTVKASVTPDPDGKGHMMMGMMQETTAGPTVSHGGAAPITGGEQTSIWLPCDETMLEPEPEVKLVENEVVGVEKTIKHTFVSKTVIRPEVCSPCGKRIRFGKMAVKCRHCRMVAHPECKHKFSEGCRPNGTRGSSAEPNSLEAWAPCTHPRVPVLLVECVEEIERRGLSERGLYRIPGGERLVKELRNRFVQGKTPLMLSKVHDVHVLCGLLKDFLRRLKEPLLTFRLHRAFMEAAELADEDNSTAIFYQAIAELPKPNRDTLAFLILHLHRVMKSRSCQMDQNNLARVFGPTLVGHGMPEPSPTTIMRDTNVQPKVISRLLSLPELYWRRILAVQDQTSSTTSLDGCRGRFFKPVTSPEVSSCYKTPGLGTVSGRIRNQGHAIISSNGRVEPGRRFFPSPS